MLVQHLEEERPTWHARRDFVTLLWQTWLVRVVVDMERATETKKQANVAHSPWRKGWASVEVNESLCSYADGPASALFV